MVKGSNSVMVCGISKGHYSALYVMGTCGNGDGDDGGGEGIL